MCVGEMIVGFISDPDDCGKWEKGGMKRETKGPKADAVALRVDSEDISGPG